MTAAVSSSALRSRRRIARSPAMSTRCRRATRSGEDAAFSSTCASIDHERTITTPAVVCRKCAAGRSQPLRVAPSGATTTGTGMEPGARQVQRARRAA